MKKPNSVDEYISSAPSEAQERLRQLRAVVKDAVPGVEEKISYGIPFYGYKGRLVYFAYAKKHIGVYAIFEPVRKQFKSELEGYEMSKGTIQFPLSEELPIELFKKLVLAQAKWNEENKK